MAELFSRLPEAIANSLKIAEKCQVEIDFKTKHYPVYLPPALRGQILHKRRAGQSGRKISVAAV